MTAAKIVGGILTLAVLAGAARFLSWGRRGAVARWRVAILLAAQPVLAGLLWLTLFPPSRANDGGTLVIATAGTSPLTVPSAGDRLVALPEAAGIGGDRAPDLGTALRRYPDARRIRVVGTGLEPRDHDAARAVSLRFDPPALPRGLIALAPPAAVAPGAIFQIAARIEGGGVVELLDPAGRIVDAGRPDATGTVTLTGTARDAGVSLFTLRRRVGVQDVAENVPVPVSTVAPPVTRLAVIAGAPGPEVKYLRRWATDAGVPVTVRTSLGGGVSLGDGAAPTPATLARTDMLVIDDRAWATLSAAQRTAIVAAVRGGMGVLLRVTGPLPDAVRRSWQAFGFVLSGG